MKLDIATEKDNEQLCSLMKKVSMPGSIELIYARDPNFFDGLNIQGKFNQAIKCVVDKEIVGIGCRSIKPMYINSKKKDVGYLSGLRGIEKYRRGTFLARGYKYLKLLNEDKRAAGYITTIIEDNKTAKTALTGARAGLPDYLDYDKFFTYAVIINKRRKKKKTHGFTIRKARQTDKKKIISFLQQEGKKKQFFPHYEENDFSSGYTKDFNWDDFYIAQKGGEIAGTLAKWNQSKYKQTKVVKYNNLLKFFRPLLNIFLMTAGLAPLPKINCELKMFFISFICIKNNNNEIFNALLNEVYEDNKRKNYHFFGVGLHEKDPLNKSMKLFHNICYVSRLYIVFWENQKKFYDSLNKDYIPYLELASL